MSTRVTIRIFAATCFCAASVVGQQTPGHAAAPALAKVSTQAPAQKWHTPWGDPDLQGTWTNATTTPLERPAKYMGREFLTKEERAAQDKVTEVATDKRHERGTPQDVEDAYNGAWWDRGRSDGRTSLIYDPPDGLIPPLTAAAKKRIAAMPHLDTALEGQPGTGVYAGPESVDLYPRCIIRAPLPRVPTGYDNNYEIVQSPGLVAIYQEQIHETRVIPISRTAHLNSGVRQWLGDSRGHWEGETLVAETTNFGDQATFQNASKNMKLVERWTRLADGHIDYRFTVSDPDTWSKPWSAMIPWNKTGTLYEYACHEDNYGLYGILAGARAKEKQASSK
jgi:hypothetical protein